MDSRFKKLVALRAPKQSHPQLISPLLRSALHRTLPASAPIGFRCIYVLARRSRARQNEPCATHWAVRQKARNSPHKPPSPRAASRQRTELRNRAQSPRAARNRIPRAGKQLPRNRRENRAQAKHTRSHKDAVEHPRRPQVPVRDRARRAHQAQRSLHAVHWHRPPRRRLRAEQCINQILTSTEHRRPRPRLMDASRVDGVKTPRDAESSTTRHRRDASSMAIGWFPHR